MQNPSKRSNDIMLANLHSTKVPSRKVWDRIPGKPRMLNCPPLHGSNTGQLLGAPIIKRPAKWIIIPYYYVLYGLLFRKLDQKNKKFNNSGQRNLSKICTNQNRLHSILLISKWIENTFLIFLLFDTISIPPHAIGVCLRLRKLFVNLVILHLILQKSSLLYLSK